MHTPSWPHLTLLHSFALHPPPPVPPDVFGTRLEERLLAYLALRPGVARSRADIVATFWPTVETGKARKLLSLYLFKLKERLARSGVVNVIEDTRETLLLSTSLRTDAQAFAELVLAGTVAHSPVERAQHLQAAVEMYGDGLLPAYDYPWVTEQREQLEVLYRHAVASLADLLDPSGGMRDLLDAMPPSAWKGLARLSGSGEPSGRSDERPGSGAEAAHEPSGGTPADDDAFADAGRPTPFAEPSALGKPLPLADLVPFVHDAAEALRGTDPQPAIDRLTERIEAICNALRQRPTVRSYPQQLRIAADLWRYWYVTRRVPEGRTLLDALLTSRLGAPADVRAAALHAAGTMANLEGDRGVGIPRLQEAVRIWPETGDDTSLLRSIVNLALAHHDAGAFDAARPLHAEAIRLARRLGEEGSLTRALYNAALTELKLGNHRAARAHLDELLALPSAGRDPRLLAGVNAHLATAALQAGDLHAARAAAEAGLEALALAPEPANAAVVTCVIGRIHYREGRFDDARAWYERSADHARDAKDFALTGMVLGYLALTYERLGQPGLAAQCMMNATTLMRGARADELRRRFEVGAPTEVGSEAAPDPPAPDLVPPSVSRTPGRPRSRPVQPR